MSANRFPIYVSDKPVVDIKSGIVWVTFGSDGPILALTVQAALTLDYEMTVARHRLTSEPECAVLPFRQKAKPRRTS